MDSRVAPVITITTWSPIRYEIIDRETGERLSSKENKLGIWPTFKTASAYLKRHPNRAKRAAIRGIALNWEGHEVEIYEGPSEELLIIPGLPPYEIMSDVQKDAVLLMIQERKARVNELNRKGNIWTVN